MVLHQRKKSSRKNHSVRLLSKHINAFLTDWYVAMKSNEGLQDALHLLDYEGIGISMF